MELDVDIKGLESFDSFDSNSKVFEDGIKAGLQRSVLLVQREAVRNAPRSPTQQQKDAVRKTRKNVRRKASSHSRANPGGLMRSISASVNSNGKSASVFVASNSEAASYAEKMHDEKGKTWFHRGIGTIAKGARADDKFIERAVLTNEDKVREIIGDAIEKAMQL